MLRASASPRLSEIVFVIGRSCRRPSMIVSLHAWSMPWMPSWVEIKGSWACLSPWKLQWKWHHSDCWMRGPPPMGTWPPRRRPGCRPWNLPGAMHRNSLMSCRLVLAVGGWGCTWFNSMFVFVLWCFVHVFLSGSLPAWLWWNFMKLHWKTKTSHQTQSSHQSQKWTPSLNCLTLFDQQIKKHMLHMLSQYSQVTCEFSIWQLSFLYFFSIPCPQVDFLGPIFTRVAMRDLGFLDPQDRRGLGAFGRAAEPPNGATTPQWGAVARRAVAEALEKIREELGVLEHGFCEHLLFFWVYLCVCVFFHQYKYKYYIIIYNFVVFSKLFWMFWGADRKLEFVRIGYNCLQLPGQGAFWICEDILLTYIDQILLDVVCPSRPFQASCGLIALGHMKGE